jgi:hypothetical protein
MAASQMGQVGSYYNPAAAAYGSLSAASMAAAAAAAAAQQSAISGLSAPAQVGLITWQPYTYLPSKANLLQSQLTVRCLKSWLIIKRAQIPLYFDGKFLMLQLSPHLQCLNSDFSSRRFRAHPYLKISIKLNDSKLW